jgi:hypothetical protein
MRDTQGKARQTRHYEQPCVLQKSFNIFLRKIEKKSFTLFILERQDSLQKKWRLGTGIV